MRSYHSFGRKLLKWAERRTRTNIHYLLYSGFWMNASTIVISGLAFGVYVLAAHVLPKDTYGTYQYLLSLNAVALGLTLTGMNSALSRAVAQGNEGTVRVSIPIQFIWSLLASAGALGLGIYYFLGGNLLLALGCLAISFTVPITAAYNSYGAVLLGRGDFRSGFWYGLLVALPTYAAIVASMIWVPYALAIFIGNVAVTALMTFIAYRHIATHRPLSGPIDASSLGYGKHLSLMNIAGAIAAQADTLLAFHFLGSAQVAVYAFSTAIPDRVGSLLKFIPAAALPRFSERPIHDIRASLGKKLAGLALLGLLLAGVYAFIAPTIFRIFFPAYMESVPFSQWYSIAILAIIGTVITSALTAHRSIRQLYIINVIVPVLQVASQLVGVLNWGLWGLIGAKVLSSLFASALPVVLFFSTPGREDLSD